jgi:Helicase HerA, central domain
MLISQSQLNYWRGSALNKGQNQELELYNSWGLNIFKLKAVPDFASGRFKLMEHLDPSARVAFIAGLQKSLLKNLAYFTYTQYNNSEGEISCGYSLRIIYNVTGLNPLTEIYLIGRVATKTSDIQTALTNQSTHLQSVLKSQLYQFEFNSDLDKKFIDQTQWLNLPQAPFCYEVIKSEEVFQWLEQDQKYFYSPGNFQVNKGNNMIALFEQIQGYQQNICIDITLIPTQVEGYEKKVISRYIEALSDAGKGSKDEEIDPDSNTQRAKSVYEEIKKKYYSGIVFLHSFRVFSPSQDTCQGVANQLAACGIGNTVSPKIIAVNNRNYAAQTLQQVNINEQAFAPGIWNTTGKVVNGFQGPDTLKRLHRLIDLDEASAFFRLPIPLNQPCPGVQYDSGSAFVAERAKNQAKTITIGHYFRNVKTNEICEFDIEQLKTHLLIVGGSGSGKTTTTFNLMTQLWGKHKIPFMIFDPKVTPEYRYLKRLPEFKDDLLIFTPGQEFIAPFRINPFDVISGIPLQEHISRIFDCFMGALPLDDPLPSFIQEAIDINYEKRGWNLAYSRGGDLDKDNNPLFVPTMQDLYDKVLDLAQKNYGSDKEVGDRIKGALRARLYRLTAKSGVGSMLQASRKLPLEELMKKPIIFELGGLNQEEQSLFSLFILVFVFEYIRAVRVGKFQPQTRADGSTERATDLDLRHVILVEEAHNMLGKEQGEGGNSKSKVVDKFAQIMREMRATGEGVIVVDQSPAALAQSVVDATNLKLMHRLPSPDDREYLGRSMCLTEGESQLSGIFSPGECFYYVPGWDAAKRVATENFKNKPGVNENLSTPFTDNDVISSMSEFLKRDHLALISSYQNTAVKIKAEISRLENFIANTATNPHAVEAMKKKIEDSKNQLKQIEAQIQTLSQKDY